MKIEKTSRQELASKNLLLSYLCHEDDHDKEIKDVSSYVINLEVPKRQGIESFFHSPFPIFLKEGLVCRKTYKNSDRLPSSKNVFIIPSICIPRFDVYSEPKVIYFYDDQDFKEKFQAHMTLVILGLIRQATCHKSVKRMSLYNVVDQFNVASFIEKHTKKILRGHIRRRFYITETIDRKDVFYAVNMKEKEPYVYAVNFSLLGYESVEDGIMSGFYFGRKTSEPDRDDFFIKHQSIFENPFIVPELIIDQYVYQQMQSLDGYFYEKDDYYIFCSKEDAQRFAKSKK